MKELASALSTEVDSAVAHFGTLDENTASANRGSGKWIKKEILGHLIDSAANNHQRFVRAQFTSPFVGPGYDQQAWVSLHHYRDRRWRELVDLWAALNRQVAAVIETVPSGKLETPCVIGDQEPRSLEWWMRDYVRHLKHHLEQLRA